MSNLIFTVKTFDSLSNSELYAVLRLRSEVFVVEQDAIYQDLDNKDQKALHVLAEKEGSIIAYARIFDKGVYFSEASIGRVVVKKEQRKHGYGHELLQFAIQRIAEHFSQTQIKISAQCYLEAFYKSHGFVPVGASYLEDGIPHIAMVRN